MINPLKLPKNGILTENPTFVLVLGICPTLAVTSSAKDGFAMGLAVNGHFDIHAINSTHASSSTRPPTLL